MHARSTRPLRAGLAAILLIVTALAAASAAPPAEASSSAWFSSPSRNIGCYMTTTWVRCDVISRTWTPTPKPPSLRLRLGACARGRPKGTGHFGCVSDTVGRLAAGPAVRQVHHDRRLPVHEPVDGHDLHEHGERARLPRSRVLYRFF